MDLSIIIISYNTKDLLKQCLDSIVSSLKSPSLPISYEIIVVDNHSLDGSREYLKKLLAKKPKSLSLKVIFNDENLGFAKANNQAIKIAKGKYVLLLNSDTVVLPGSIEKMIAFAQKKKDAGVIVPKLLNKDRKTSQSSCYHLPTIKRAIKEYWFGQKGAYEKYLPRGGQPVKVEAAVGAAMLIPREVLDIVGLLDERYFFYFEDLDYCRRVGKNGFCVYYLPQVKIIHYGGQSGKKASQKVNRYLVESSKKFNGFFKYGLLKLVIRLAQIKKALPLLLLIMGGLFWGIKSLLGIDYFASHDGAFHLIRLFEFDKSVRALKIPPRWAPGLARGLGVPVFNYFYPLSYYWGELIHLLLGFSFASSIRIIFILGYFLGFFFTFLFLKNFFAKLPSLLGAFFYVFSPYIFLDIYVRGNLPEFLSLMLLPGVFWGFNLILTEKSQKFLTFSLFLSSLLLSLFITAHNIIALLGSGWLTFFLCFFLLLNKKKRRKMGKLLTAFLWGLGLAAFFWLPAIGETNLTYLSQETVFDWWNHFPTIRQLIYSPWGYGSSVMGPWDGMSFQIGIVHIFSALMGITLFLIYVLEGKINFIKYKRGFFFFFLFSLFLFLFLMNHRSSFIWQNVPFLFRVQLPWRFLGFLTFSLVPLITFLFEEMFKTRYRWWSYAFGMVIVLVAIFSYHSYPHIKEEISQGAVLLSNKATETTTSANEILPINAPKDYWNISFDDTIKCSDFVCRINLDLEKGKEVIFRKFYFPLWRGEIDGSPVSVYPQKRTGLLAVSVPAGKHDVRIFLRETKLEKLADGFSLFFGVGWIAAILVFFIKRRKRHGQRS